MSVVKKDSETALPRSGISLTDAEAKSIEVVDFGLNSFSTVARYALDGFTDQGIERITEIVD